MKYPSRLLFLLTFFFSLSAEFSIEESEPLGVTDTDFVLYVSAVETERCRRGLTVAYASHCQQEAALDRPVAGHANFCPGELSTKYRELPSLLATVKHEMLHALGFSASLYAFYRSCAAAVSLLLGRIGRWSGREIARSALSLSHARLRRNAIMSHAFSDDDGEPLTPRRPDTGNPPLDEELQIHKWSDRVVRNVTRKRWMIRGGYIERTFNMIVTPRVVKEHDTQLTHIYKQASRPHVLGERVVIEVHVDVAMGLWPTYDVYVKLCKQL
ncbi:Leishmanolysin-like peptidase [Eumeta japonica]|uniref:Leishmanolysin-like peptidase n=1 Tax=Eumeta variegata TaxID=151549 RepID=A0A4C1UBD0_EUMVA|nr:Leishmanolysin-like peptidase [Eumeta japonica]